MSSDAVHTLHLDGQQLRQTPPSGLGDTFENALRERLLNLFSLFSLPYNSRPGLMFFDDDSYGEAYFAPRVTRIANTSGTVILGRNLLTREANAARPGSLVLLAMLAHEIGHAAQYLAGAIDAIGLRPTARRVELHADFLAGWALGKQADADLGRLDDAAERLFLRGSLLFTEPTFHGTNTERYTMFVRGYLASLGRPTLSVRDAIKIGMEKLDSLPDPSQAAEGGNPP